jgi:hypothetical protein
MKPELPTLRGNFYVGDVDPNEFGEEFRSTNWVGAFERWLASVRATMRPLTPPRRLRRGTPALPILTEGRRMLGRRGVRHGDRDALLMAVGVIPYRV